MAEGRKWTPELQEARRLRRAARRKAEGRTPEDLRLAGNRASVAEAAKPGFNNHHRRIKVDFSENADAAADFILGRETGDFTSIERVCQQLNLPKNFAASLTGRLRARMAPLTGEVRTATNKSLIVKLEDRLDRILHYADDYAMSGSSLKDLAIAFGIFAEKRQLLKGEPTAILSMEERASLNILIPIVLREAGRRGLTIDVSSGEPQVVGGRTLPNVPSEIGRGY